MSDINKPTELKETGVEEVKYPSHKELDMEKYKQLILAGRFDSLFNYGFDVGRQSRHQELQKAREEERASILEYVERSKEFPAGKHDGAWIYYGNLKNVLTPPANIINNN